MEERARWEGRMEAKIEAHDGRIIAMEKSVAKIEEGMTSVKELVASLRTLIGVWAALGGLIGAGLITGLVELLNH